MAEATIDTVMVPTVVERTIDIPKDYITLTLSKEEAKYLVALLGKVGGQPEGIRTVGASIRMALISVVGKWYFLAAAMKSGASRLQFNDGFTQNNSFTNDAFNA